VGIATPIDANDSRLWCMACTLPAECRINFFSGRQRQLVAGGPKAQEVLQYRIDNRQTLYSSNKTRPA
jgi:hypothetical protein